MLPLRDEPRCHHRTSRHHILPGNLNSIKNLICNGIQNNNHFNHNNHFNQVHRLSIMCKLKCRVFAFVQNPSNEARTISPGRRLKNFCPTLEFATVLVKKPETFTTPESIPVATFSDIFVICLTLFNNERCDVNSNVNQYIEIKS